LKTWLFVVCAWVVRGGKGMMHEMSERIEMNEKMTIELLAKIMACAYMRASPEKGMPLFLCDVPAM
jgi:hypothetical protein